MQFGILWAQSTDAPRSSDCSWHPPPAVCEITLSTGAPDAPQIQIVLRSQEQFRRERDPRRVVCKRDRTVTSRVACTCYSETSRPSIRERFQCDLSMSCMWYTDAPYCMAVYHVRRAEPALHRRADSPRPCARGADFVLAARGVVTVVTDGSQPSNCYQTAIRR